MKSTNNVNQYTPTIYYKFCSLTEPTVSTAVVKPSSEHTEATKG